MSINLSSASAAHSESFLADEGTRARDASYPINEGLGVFRALLLMLILYLALGSLFWFVWHAWRHIH